MDDWVSCVQKDVAKKALPLKSFGSTARLEKRDVVSMLYPDRCI